MNIVICDDEPVFLKMEKEGCEQYMELDDTLFCYESSIELKSYLLTEKPQVDLFILDIDMPDVNGIELKKIISELYEDINIVFVTGYDSFMRDAFGRNVIGYWSRDKYKDEIGVLISRLRNEILNKKIIEIMDGNQKVQFAEKRIFLISAQRVYSVVQYAEYYNADNDDIRIITNTYRVSLNDWEQKLNPKEFCRVNRSAIIAWRYVDKITNCIEMINGDTYRIPAGKKKMLVRKYLEYKFEHANG